MGRPKKNPLPKGDLEAAIGATLRAWMSQSLGRRHRTETQQITALYARCGVGKETIRQILRAQQSARIDNLQAIVKALGHDLSDLFQPNEGPKEGQDDASGSSRPPGTLQRRSG